MLSRSDSSDLPLSQVHLSSLDALDLHYFISLDSELVNSLGIELLHLVDVLLSLGHKSDLLLADLEFLLGSEVSEVSSVSSDVVGISDSPSSERSSSSDESESELVASSGLSESSGSQVSLSTLSGFLSTLSGESSHLSDSLSTLSSASSDSLGLDGTLSDVSSVSSSGLESSGSDGLLVDGIVEVISSWDSDGLVDSLVGEALVGSVDLLVLSASLGSDSSSLQTKLSTASSDDGALLDRSLLVTMLNYDILIVGNHT